MNVNGLAAVITGGGSGIGAEVARHCATAGMKVALLDVNMDGANAVAAEIGGVAIECDVTSAESGEAAIAAAREANGVGRLLVNCAGVGTPGRIVGRNGPLPLDAFNTVIQVNLVGSFNMMRLFAADLGEADSLEDGERGLIVSTASVAATEGQIGQAAYASSKGGIVSLNLVAAREFASRRVPNGAVVGDACRFVTLESSTRVPAPVADAVERQNEPWVGEQSARTPSRQRGQGDVVSRPGARTYIFGVMR